MSCKSPATRHALRQFLLPGAIAVLLGTACAGPTGLQHGSDSATPEEFLPGREASRVQAATAMPSDVGARFRFHVLAGELAGARGDPEGAALHLIEAVKLRNSNELARRGSQYAIAAQRTDLARTLVEFWEAAGDSDGVTNELLLRLALEEGHQEEATTRAARLLDAAEAAGEPQWQRLARTMSGTEDGRATAIAVMQDLVETRGTESDEAHYALGLMAVHFGQYEAARPAAERAFHLSSSATERDRRLLLLAGALIRGEGPEGAERALAPLIDAAGDPVTVRQNIADLYSQSDAPEQARRLLAQALELAPDDTQLLLSYADAARATGDLRAWRDRLETLLEMGGDAEREAAYRFALVADDGGNIDQARRWYERARGGDRDAQAGLRLAQLDAEAGDIDSARAKIEALRDEHPQLSARLLRAEGEMLYAVSDYEAAATVLRSGVAAYPRDEAIRYSYALALDKAGAHDEAEQQLRVLLAMDPENAHALNALGYMLTLRSERLEEARAYIEQALEILPDDPAITDSMGWVLYKMGKPDQALVYLERAYEDYPDAEVAAHLGEVLWKLGKQERAREIWDAALAEEPDHPVLVETLQRLDPR